jgi:hypothetical protein
LCSKGSIPFKYLGLLVGANSRKLTTIFYLSFFEDAGLGVEENCANSTRAPMGVTGKEVGRLVGLNGKPCVNQKAKAVMV